MASTARLRSKIENGGWLVKRGGFIKNWKRRWFTVVTHAQHATHASLLESPRTASTSPASYLAYFKAPPDSVASMSGGPQGTIHLHGATLIKLPKDAYNKDFAMGLTPPGSSRTFVLVADSEAVREAWMQHLAAAGALVPSDEEAKETLADSMYERPEHLYSEVSGEDVQVDAPVVAPLTPPSSARRDSAVDDDAPLKLDFTAITYTGVNERRPPLSELADGSTTDSSTVQYDVYTAVDHDESESPSPDDEDEVELQHATRAHEPGIDEQLVQLVVSRKPPPFSSPALTPEHQACDWNERYLHVTELPCSTPQEMADRDDAMQLLQSDFCTFTTAVAQDLVAQLRSPERRTQLSVGHVDFRLVTDEHGVFGGRHVCAHKVALNELRAAHAIANMLAPDLHPPLHVALTSALYVRGHLVVATARTPTSHDTLQLGSDDAGTTLRDSSAALRVATSRVADYFNLSPHTVVGKDGTTIETYLAGDAEGHVVADRLYLLHVGRVFPAQCPRTVAHPQAFLYLQFRPEFCRLYCSRSPLSSDVFTRWGRQNGAAHNKAAADAYRYLLDHVVPTLGQELVQLVDEEHRARLQAEPDEEQAQRFAHLSSRLDVSRLFHRRGVNMRLLGLVRESITAGRDNHAALLTRKLLLQDMLVRCVKSVFRRHARELPSDSDAASQQLAAVLLARLLGAFPARPEDTDRMWHTIIALEMRFKFSVDATMRDVDDLRDELVDPDNAYFLPALLRAMQVRWTGAAHLDSSSLSAALASHERSGAELPLTAFVHSRTLASNRGPVETEADLQLELAVREAVLGDEEDPRLLSSLLALLQLYTRWARDHQSAETRARGDRVAKRAIRLCDKKELGMHRIERATAYSELGLFYRVRQGDPRRAVKYLDMALAEYRASFGVRMATPTDVEATLTPEQVAMLCAASLRLAGVLEDELTDVKRAHSVLQRTLALAEARFGNAHAFVCEALDKLAKLVASKMQQTDQATETLTRALLACETVFGRDHPRTGLACNSLAWVHRAVGRNELALPLYERSLAILERLLGASHDKVAVLLNNMGQMCRALGEDERALQMLQRSLDLKEEAHGKQHPSVASTLVNLSDIYRTRGDMDTALQLLVRAKDIYEQTFGPEHPNTAVALNQLGMVFMSQEKYEEARAFLERGLTALTKSLGQDHGKVAICSNNLAQVYDELGQLSRAVALYERCIRIIERNQGADHVMLAAPLANLAGLQRRMDQPEAAIRNYKRALAVKMKAYGQKHPTVAATAHGLAIALEETGNWKQASAHYKLAIHIAETCFGTGHPSTRTYTSDFNDMIRAKQLHDQQQEQEQHPAAP